MDANRNLLVGILAVQMGFASKDALVAAMNRWLLEKGTPLIALLGLDSVERQDLERVVQLYLKRHGDDVERSLAAISSVESVKEAVKGVPDPDVQASLGFVGGGTLKQTHVHRTQDASLRFRILRPHAKGGLGEVFVARDTELNRDVALKEIQGEHADNVNSRGRFLLEAEVTGGLEHPNIVPVYGLGTYADGRPYYAMRFIKGDSLKDAIEDYHRNTFTSDAAKNLAFRNLLKRFIDVCNAVAYAHSRGILHRDLKPGNVMLGKYGETLVVDWGLAKSMIRGRQPSESGRQPLEVPTESATLIDEPLRLSDDGYAETLTGHMLGTPGFMSPEQAAGKLEALGPATDVYSLGATLYVLLTGQMPFRVDVLANTQAGRFPAPQTIKPDLAPALNAIALKAMALAPMDRYANVAAIAADAERFLADEPISAYTEPFPQHAGRWIRKHPVVVASLTAALLMGLIGASSAVVLVNNEKTRTEAARLDEHAQRMRAEENERKAVEANADVRELFQQSLATYNDMAVNIQIRFQEKPETRELRDTLLLQAKAGLDRLKETANLRNPVLMKDALEAQRRVDETGGLSAVSVMGLGRNGDRQLAAGNVSAAMDIYAEARKQAETLTTAQPHQAPLLNDLAVCVEKHGDACMQCGFSADGLRAFERHLGVREEILALQPRQRTPRNDVCVSLSRLGEAHWDLGQSREALALFDRSLRLRKDILDEDPADFQARRQVCASHHRIAGVTMQMGRHDRAMEHWAACVDHHRQMMRKEPGNLAHKRDFLATTFDLIKYYSSLGQIPHALALCEENAGTCGDLIRTDARDARYRSSVHGICELHGDVLVQAGHPPQAIEYYKKAREALAEVVKLDPLRAKHRQNLAFAYEKLGSTYLKMKLVDSAVEHFNRCTQIWESFAESDASHADPHRMLCQNFENLGNVHFTNHEYSKALDWYRKAKDHQARWPWAGFDPQRCLTQMSACEAALKQ